MKDSTRLLIEFFQGEPWTKQMTRTAYADSLRLWRHVNGPARVRRALVNTARQPAMKDSTRLLIDRLRFLRAMDLAAIHSRSDHAKALRLWRERNGSRAVRLSLLNMLID